MVVSENVRIATRDGVRLAYVDAGAGDPPLVFVHGWCCNNSHWRAQVPEFSSRHRVVAVDQRGHGQSDKPDQDYTIGGFVDDLAWLIRELGLDRPVVIGHSMGGLIALNLAHEHPNLLRAIVTVDAPAVPIPNSMQPTVTVLVEGLRSAEYRDVASEFVATFMFNESSDPALKAEIVAGMSVAPQRLMHTALVSLLREESLPEGPIPVPAMFVRAATQTAGADEIRARYPGIEVAEVEAAHFLQMEKPEETNRILSRFLEGIA
jgi:pimeloyl-ACP methyl ester carboxylesterase